MPNGGHTVTPGDLLAFFVGAAVVPNWNLINSTAQARDFDRELRLETKTVTAELQRVEHLPPKHLITNFHVSEIQITEKIAEEREGMIAHIMPEVEHTMRAAVETIAEYHIGKTFQNGLEQLGIIARIVFEVGVLNQDHVDGRVFEPGAQSSALALVRTMKHQFEPCRRKS